MQPRLAELFSYLDSTRAKLVETVGAINPSFAGVRSRGDCWSAEENLAHLAITEERIAGLIGKSVEWAKENGIGPAMSSESIMSSMDQFHVIDPPVKAVAPQSVAPPEERPIDESLASLSNSRTQLKAALLAGEGLDLSVVKRKHPGYGEIDLYQWALFVAQHEERHRRQIERTMDEVTELAAESAPIV